MLNGTIIVSEPLYLVLQIGIALVVSVIVLWEMARERHEHFTYVDIVKQLIVLIVSFLALGFIGYELRHVIDEYYTCFIILWFLIPIWAWAVTSRTILIEWKIFPHVARRARTILMYMIVILSITIFGYAEDVKNLSGYVPALKLLCFLFPFITWKCCNKTIEQSKLIQQTENKPK